MKKANDALKVLAYTCLVCVVIFGMMTIVGCGGGGGGGGGGGDGGLNDSGFTNASLDGTYHFVDIWLGDQGSGADWSASQIGTMTFNGAGNYTMTGEYSEIGIGANLPTNDIGNYSVNADGTFSFTTSDPSTLDGAISGTTDLFIYSNIREEDEQAIGIGIRQ
jgi:hypothetical protein